VRRIGCCDKKHAVERELIKGGARDRYVSTMNRVEGASEQSQSQASIMR